MSPKNLFCCEGYIRDSKGELAVAVHTEMRRPVDVVRHAEHLYLSRKAVGAVAWMVSDGVPGQDAKIEILLRLGDTPQG